MKDFVKFFCAGLLTALLATADQIFVIQKNACLAAFFTILLIGLSTHIVVDITTTKKKVNILYYASGSALGTFLAVTVL